MLFQELLDEYGLEPHYTIEDNITLQNPQENDAMEGEKAEHVVKIKQEVDTICTPPFNSIDDMDDDETMKTLDRDDTSNSDSDQEHEDMSDMIGHDPGHNDKDHAQNVEKLIPKTMKTEFIDETNEIDDPTVAEQAIGKRSISEDKSANEAKKIKKEIESDDESEKHSTTNENEADEGEDDWMQDMEKEFAKYKERHDCDICRDGFPSSKEEIDHFYAVWMEKGEKYDEKPLCNVCGKTFTRNGDLKRHLKKHSGVIVGTCPVCKKEFWDAQFLKAHMRKHATGNYIL